MGINFARCNRRGNRCSPALFDHKAIVRPAALTGQRTEHVKTGHVKTDRFRGHFRGHFRGTWDGSWGFSWGVLDGLKQGSECS